MREILSSKLGKVTILPMFPNSATGNERTPTHGLRPFTHHFCTRQQRPVSIYHDSPNNKIITGIVKVVLDRTVIPA